MPTSEHRILVTGGAGFIGGRVVDVLLAEPGSAVAVLDNLAVGRPMPKSRPGLSTYKADIRDGEALARVCAEFAPRTIVHLAAVHHIPTCETERSYSLEVNVVGTERLLEAAQAAHVPYFVLASSGAVYEWQEGFLEEKETPLAASDNYSLAKRTNESQVRFWAARTGGRAGIARIFNTIGHDDPNAHLVPDIISQIDPKAQRVEISLGNVSPRRDYIHANDTARAIAAIAMAQFPGPVEAFNVSSGTDVSVRELVGMLGEVMGVTIVIKEDPARMRRVDRPSQLGSTGKIRTMLGFEPRQDLRDALRDIVRQSGWSARS